MKLALERKRVKRQTKIILDCNITEEVQKGEVTVAAEGGKEENMQLGGHASPFCRVDIGAER